MAGTVAAIAATVLLFGGVLGEGDVAQPTPVAAAALSGSFAVGDTESLVLGLERQVRERPDDAEALTLLGLAYQQRARETADAADLSRSQTALHRALALAPEDALATGGLASLALSRHQFREALVLARRMRGLVPESARPFALLGDALIELGRYGEAFKAFDRMAALKPSLVSYSRVSYARELIGDFAGAAEAMRLAIDAAAGQPEALAWSYTQLGKLYFAHGRVGAASREYRSALTVLPGYVYALDALAQMEAARGNLRRAISLERRAANAVPLPQFIGVLGDLHRVAGDEGAARKHYALIGAIERLLKANGVRTDLETALFKVDHGIRLPEALALARAAHANRPSIDGDDVLAWALARNGRCGEALYYSKRALNPHFSVLWAPVARRYTA
jgi:tetratricopeptide (TPR) repeat protein